MGPRPAARAPSAHLRIVSQCDASRISFWIAGAAALTGQRGWIALATGVVAASLVLCALEWPVARIGLGVNLAIALALVLAQRMEWFAAA